MSEQWEKQVQQAQEHAEKYIALAEKLDIKLGTASFLGLNQAQWMALYMHDVQFTVDARVTINHDHSDCAYTPAPPSTRFDELSLGLKERYLELTGEPWSLEAGVFVYKQAIIRDIIAKRPEDYAKEAYRQSLFSPQT